MILRTEEIKDKQDSDDVKVDEDFQPDGNFFSTASGMFSNIFGELLLLFLNNGT